MKSQRLILIGLCWEMLVLTYLVKALEIFTIPMASLLAIYFQLEFRALMKTFLLLNVVLI